MNDSGCANSYSDQIIREFPDTRYGKILSDPDYVKNLLTKKDEIVLAYNQAYDLYSNAKYQEAFDLLQVTKTKIVPPHPLQAKMALLTAFCVGYIEGKDVYINSLRDVVANYPSTPEETKAKEILRFLKGDQNAFIEVSAAEMENAKFKLEDDKMHFVTVILYNPEDKIVDKAKISISDYNLNYHKSENLKMTSLELEPDSNTPIILIRKFDQKSIAMKYYNGIKRKPNEFIKDFPNFEFFVVTQNNYREILRLKSFKEYQTFFNKNYLSEENKD